MKAFENFKIEKVGDERLEERIRLAYIKKTVLEDDIQELTSEGEGGVGRAYEELNEASEEFYMLLELRELRERRKSEDTKPADLRERLKKHILAIREEIKNAGFNASYISMASFENEKGRNGKFIKSAYIYNDPKLKLEEQFMYFYDFTEEER